MTQEPLNHEKTLRSLIEAKSATIGIIGLGYVGLPLALAFAEKGFRVLGFDVDPEKVDKINRGESYIKHLDPTRLARATAHAHLDGDATGRAGQHSTFKIQNSKFKIAGSANVLLTATADFGRLSEADAILICVPTPLGPHKEPDMRYVESSTRAVRQTLRPGQLVILESTTYPGTTDDLLRPILESPLDSSSTSTVVPNTGAGGGEFKIQNSKFKTDDGTGGRKLKTQNSKFKIDDGVGGLHSEFRIPNSEMKCGEHFFLAFSPEREDPGNPSFGTTNTPKVVGGVDPVSGDLAQTLYDQIVERTVRVSSARVAEASKLTENIFRSTIWS